MPLKAGKDKKTIHSNVGEMLRSFKKTGKIGGTRPRDQAHAAKVASAAALSKARGKGSSEKGTRRFSGAAHALSKGMKRR